MSTTKGTLFGDTNVSSVKSTPIAAGGDSILRLSKTITIPPMGPAVSYDTLSMWTYVVGTTALHYFISRRHASRSRRRVHRQLVARGRREFWRKPVVVFIEGIELRERALT